MSARELYSDSDSVWESDDFSVFGANARRFDLKKLNLNPVISLYTDRNKSAVRWRKSCWWSFSFMCFQSCVSVTRVSSMDTQDWSVHHLNPEGSKLQNNMVKISTSLYWTKHDWIHEQTSNSNTHMLLHTDLAEAGSKDSKTLERKLVKDVSKEAEQLQRHEWRTWLSQERRPCNPGQNGLRGLRSICASVPA